MQGPLCSIRVLELGGFISGPFAGQLLADLGAEVVKIEDPAIGDPFRSFDGSGYSAQFRAYNAGKKSVTIDLKTEEGRRSFTELAASADAILDNFRPGTLDKLGFPPEVLRKINPTLIQCSITGFGSSGPYRTRPAYDTVASAMGGLMSQFIDSQRPLIAGPALADPIVGFYAALGLVSALFERERTKNPRRIEVSMMDAVIAFNVEPFSRYFKTGELDGPYKRAAYSQSYALPCADGLLIALHLSSPPKFWEGLLASIERPDMATDPRFMDRQGRVSDFEALWEELSVVFKKRKREEWIETLKRHEVPHAPIYDLAEVVKDEHALQTGVFVDLHHPEKGRVKHIAPPILFDGERCDRTAAPPVLGEHNDELLGSKMIPANEHDPKFASLGKIRSLS
jgi:crotonobetainyl-CoA:carnitine CoA-transferase CaiB-like acyl-CoA transferase